MSISQALSAHQQGNLADAEAIYIEILKTRPTDFDAMHLLGVVCLQTGRSAQGVELIQRAVELSPRVADAFNHLGTGFRDLRRLADALANYDQAIALNPHHADALNNRAVILQELGRFDDALASYRLAVAANPAFVDAHLNLAKLLKDLKRPAEALASFEHVAALRPTSAAAFNSLGNALQDLGRFERAAECYDKAIELKPDFAQAYSNRGVALTELNRLHDALASHDSAIQLEPEFPEAINNRGNVLRALGRFQDALQSFDCAIVLKADFARAHENRGAVLLQMDRPADALASYQIATALDPKRAEPFNNQGVALWKLKRPAEALQCLNQSLELQPDYAEAHNNRGAVLLDLNCLQAALVDFETAATLKPGYVDALRNSGNVLAMLGRRDQAFAAYNQLFAMHPDLPGLEGDRLNAKMRLCDWNHFESDWAHLIAAVNSGKPNGQPFYFLSGPSSADDQLQCSQLWAAHHFPPHDGPFEPGRRYHHDRIRLAYVSADFRQHPLSYLTAGLFECHDRLLFETTAISIGPEDNSDVRQRLITSFERFIDASATSDDQIAGLIKELEIDILVDLMGYTTSSRTGIFARRPAPIQVSYLGYPGTMGASYIDYLIADRTVIPQDQRACYSESVVVLPNSYLANDAERAIADTGFTRQELWLPAHSFVFCCFNSSYKISPAIFNVWMNILKRVPDSVLWLYESNASAASNLRAHATARGVAATRLIFAKQMPVAEHLARLRAADLCLDTLPYNGHTTACDALWAGVPLLTRLGTTFVGRVAASALLALGLPELVTTTQQAYEDAAVELATHPDKLSAISRKLADHRLTAPLFDSRRFTRHIEAAFSEMMARHNAGQPPSDLGVTDDGLAR
jgi:predicted O-linked N-acetylglucosamine transferase (SPINDLY family)